MYYLQKKYFKRHCFSFLLWFIFYVSSCSAQQKELSQMESLYSIDLDKKREMFIPLSKYFKSPQPIILETKKECLIGHINELQICNGNIYVLDISLAKSLFVFDMDGRFIRKIGSLGNGPGEYIQLGDFTLDTQNKFVFLLDYGRSIHKYRFDGTFVQTITPKLLKTNIKYIQYYNGKLFISVRAFQPSLDDYMLLEIDINNGEILSKFLSLKYNKGWAEAIYLGHSFFMSRLNDPPKYSQMFMDYIVDLGKDITPYIELKSKNLVTEKDIRNLLEDKSDTRVLFEKMRNYFRGSSKIFDINSYLENDHLIMFNYRCGYMDQITVIVNKTTGTMELANDISNDLIFKNGENRFFTSFVFSDLKGAYKILNTRSIEDFQESIRNNEIVSDFDKLDELLKLEEDANPVIFYYEFK